MSIVILIAGLALLALGCFVAGCVIVHRARRQRQAEELRPFAERRSHDRDRQKHQGATEE